MSLVLLIVLIVVLFGGGYYGRGAGWPAWGYGGIPGVLILILIILLISGRLGPI